MSSYANFKQNHNVTEKIDCVCGGFYTYFSKSKHLKTKKHTTFIETGVVYQKKIIDAKYHRDWRMSKKSVAC